MMPTGSWWQRPRRSSILIALFGGVVVGLGLARLYLNPPVVLVISSLFLTAMALHRSHSHILLVIAVSGSLLGCWRGAQFMQQLAVYDTIVDRQVHVEVVAESDGYYHNGQLSFDVGNVYIHQPHIGAIPGKATIRARGVNAVFRGDKLLVTGNPYRTRGNKQFGMSFAQAELIGRQSTVFDIIRQRFSAGVHNALPEPYASFGLGLLIGQRVNLPSDVAEDLSRVGLTHIIAVSGANLTIIIQAVRRRMDSRSKYQATIWALALISGFLMITGFSASIVRAAFVSMLSLWAWYYGRKFNPVALIICAAAVTAWWYPIYLWSDIGWYLSFLAFFGVLVVAPLWQQRRDAKGRRATVLNQLVIESFWAQAMTTPIIMYIFARLSVIGLLSNIMVVPLVPLTMLATAVAGVVGVIMPVAAGWVGLPARVLLTYMLDIAHLLSSWRYANVSQALSLTGMVIMYGCMTTWLLLLWQKQRKTATVTDTEQEFYERNAHVWS